MNYYHAEVNGNNQLFNMEMLSKHLPDNISQLGFLCPVCDTYIYYSNNNSSSTLCSCCTEDSYYNDEIKSLTDDLNKYHKLIMDNFRYLLFNEYYTVHKVEDINKVLDSSNLISSIQTNEGEYYLKEAMTENNDIFDIARVYADFTKDKIIKEEDLELFEPDFIEYYGIFRRSFDELLELTKAYEDKLNTFVIVFSIPKEKDTFNVLYKIDRFMGNDYDFKVTIESVNSLSDNGYESLKSVKRDENNTYVFIEE